VRQTHGAPLAQSIIFADVAPIGGKCVRAEVVYFFGGERWLSGFWKVAQGFGLCCTYGFPRADPVRRYSDRGYVADVGFHGLLPGLDLLGRLFWQRHEARFRLGGICTLLSYFARRVVVEYKKFSKKKKKKKEFSYHRLATAQPPITSSSLPHHGTTTLQKS